MRPYFSPTPLYFFNVRNLGPSAPAQCEVFPDNEAAWNEATHFAAGLFKDVEGKLRPGDEWGLEVTDQAGKAIFNIQISTKNIN
jgi:hypothetical protein